MSRDDHLPAGELVAYQVGDLSPERAAAVAMHLAGCATCRAELAGFVDVDRLLQEADPQLYDDETHDRAAVRALVRRELRRRVRGGWWRVLLVALPIKLALFLLARRAGRGRRAQLAACGAIAALTVIVVRRLPPLARDRSR